LRVLPLSGPLLGGKQDELDKLGTELWNLSTRVQREQVQIRTNRPQEVASAQQASCLLRVFSFLLLDSARSHTFKGEEHKNCIRIMKVALKAAKVCIKEQELEGATKVLERAADYEELLSQSVHKDDESGEEELGHRLRVEYFAVRAALVKRHSTPMRVMSTFTDLM